MNGVVFDIICIITSALMVGIAIPQIYKIPYFIICISGLVSIIMRSYRLSIGYPGVSIKNILW